ncbi:phage tail repeat-like family [Trichomonas vaginalis G3]|uniref:phage tail repeat-like family n=1 Tax=Trichomonas vaginalis (strain ATCC PRA-98 / G3) TaxID=412133 RepID=UPI0021E589C4|nr:phage tail repeat-like family [Trichomonas vaginalis G3]KAI5502620.1 phage tail repeat-like family [Trichomonas vaginalis G3]
MTEEVETVDLTPQTKSSEPLSKPVKELTDEEKNSIIESARSGNTNPNYKVAFYRNGTASTSKKKQTLTNKILKSEGAFETTDGKVYFTDQQFIIEHLIDLESKYSKLYNKHKKLKGKQKQMAYDIYEDVDDTTVPASEVKSEEPKSDEKPIEEEKPKTEDKPKPKFSFQTKPSQPSLAGMGWRQRLMAAGGYVK